MESGRDDKKPNKPNRKNYVGLPPESVSLTMFGNNSSSASVATSPIPPSPSPLGNLDFEPDNRLISIAQTSVLVESNTARNLTLSNRILFTAYLHRSTADSKISVEDSQSLLLRKLPLLEDDIRKEMRYVIHKYKIEFQRQTIAELEDVRYNNIAREYTLKLFYEKIGRLIKSHGFKLESTPAQSENRLHNYKTVKTIQEDLALTNAEEYSTRLFQTFSSVVSFSLLYSFISSTIDLSNDPKLNKYATIAPQVVLVLLAIILTIAREMHRTSSIKSIYRKVEALLVTKEGHKFSLADLRVALLHSIAIRMAAEDVLEEKSKPEFKESPSL